jgi:ABC-type Fe3+-siderophore transport system permease subunit
LLHFSGNSRIASAFAEKQQSATARGVRANRMSLSLLLIGAGVVIVVVTIAGVLLFVGRSDRD